MRRIIKSEVPEFWAEFCRKHPRIHYNDLDKTPEGKAVRSQMHDYLMAEQMGICCYCCKSITKDHSHNEHIIPREGHTNKQSMDYYNLVASCSPKKGEADTCGHKKDNEKKLQSFVSPLDEACESQFEFSFVGDITGTTDKGRYTVDLLNVNSYRLKNAREALYEECISMAELCGKEYVYETYLLPQNGKLHAFADMVQYFFDRGLFDSEVSETEFAVSV